MSDARGPSAYTIERTVAAFQRISAALTADEQLADDEAALWHALKADHDVTPPRDLIERLARAIAFAEARVIEAHRFAQEMAARKVRYHDRAEAMRSALVEVLDAFGWKSSSTAWGTVTRKDGAQSALITDENKLPDEYVKVETIRTPKRDAILADLLEGVVIEGAELRNGAPFVQIRRAKLVGGDR